MRVLSLSLIFLFALAGPSLGANPGEPATTVHGLLMNGAFAAPLTNGWTESNNDIVGTGSVTTLIDGGAAVKKEQCGYRALSQDVQLASTTMVFSTNAKFHAEASKPGYHAWSGVVLTYLNKEGKSLGTTTIGYATEEAGWHDTPTAHYIWAQKQDVFADYSVSIADELKTHLKSVSPTQVDRLRVEYKAFGSGTSSC